MDDIISARCLGYDSPNAVAACLHKYVVSWHVIMLLLQVLREFAIAAGLGRKRPKPCKEARPKMGTEGEDVVADEAGGLKLRLPPRFAVGTMKAAAWQVDHLFLFAGASHVVLVVRGACQLSKWTVV